MPDKEQEIYCAWAENKFPDFGPIKKVEFDLDHYGPYSEVTPDVDQFAIITLHSQHKRRKPLKSKWWNLAELIADVTTFANQYKDE